MRFNLLVLFSQKFWGFRISFFWNFAISGSNGDCLQKRLRKVLFFYSNIRALQRCSELQIICLGYFFQGAVRSKKNFKRAVDSQLSTPLERPIEERNFQVWFVSHGAQPNRLASWLLPPDLSFPKAKPPWCGRKEPSLKTLNSQT